MDRCEEESRNLKGQEIHAVMRGQSDPIEIRHVSRGRERVHSWDQYMSAKIGIIWGKVWRREL